MMDKLVALESLLEELPEAVARRRLGDRLAQSMNALRNADHQIDRINGILDLANLTSFGEKDAEREVLETLKKEAWEVGTELETASTEDSLRDAVYDYERSLQPALAAAERAVRSHWSAVANDKFRAIQLLGELLERIGVAASLGERMQDCGRRGVSAHSAGQLPETVSRARSLLAELESLQEERSRVIGAGDVGRFINALAEGRATLAMVTPEVGAWLAENEALERFTVAPH
jgi:hypothetical protein